MEAQSKKTGLFYVGGYTAVLQRKRGRNTHQADGGPGSIWTQCLNASGLSEINQVTFNQLIESKITNMAHKSYNCINLNYIIYL